MVQEDLVAELDLLGYNTIVPKDAGNNDDDLVFLASGSDPSAGSASDDR